MYIRMISLCFVHACRSGVPTQITKITPWVMIPGCQDSVPPVLSIWAKLLLFFGFALKAKTIKMHFFCTWGNTKSQRISACKGWTSWFNFTSFWNVINTSACGNNTHLWNPQSSNEYLSLFPKPIHAPRLQLSTQQCWPAVPHHPTANHTCQIILAAIASSVKCTWPRVCRLIRKK